MSSRLPSRSSSHSENLSAPAHPLAPYGWDAGWEAEFAPYAAQGLLPGRVVRVDRGRCDVITPAGPVRADTEYVVPRDPMRVVCTGDWAAVDPGGDPQFVRTLLPRRTAFVRSTSSERSEGQILAANVDHVIIAVSLAVELDLGRIERFLALAWESGAAPLVVLTKADLVPDPTGLSYLVDDVETTAPGVQVLPVSSATGTGVDVLAAVVAGGTSVLLGASGAGKSTLANALADADVMEVQATRDADGKGRHTTTTRNLIVLPGGESSSTPRGCAVSGSGTRRAASARSSPRSTRSLSSVVSTTAPTKRSRDARCSRRSTTVHCRSADWRASASCSGRTSASSRGPTPGCVRRSGGTGR